MQAHGLHAAGRDERWPTASSRPDSIGARIVVFRLESREYAFPLAVVIEILRMVALTDVPESPPWFAGVINLRGRTVPVIDLRARLGLVPDPPKLDNAVVIAEADGRPVGFVADQVIDVPTLPPGSVDAVDDVAGEMHPVTAVARTEERLVMVLDPVRLAGDALDVSVPRDTS